MKVTPAALIIAALLVVLLSWNRIFPAHNAPAASSEGLPGIETSAAPWGPGLASLRERLTALNLPILSAEGNALHIHQHLDVFVHGAPVAVPADIGVYSAAGFISPIHTHDTTGVIHVESNVVKDFTLGQFFDIWGVRFTKDCLGGYCQNATSTLRAYVNGTPVTGDPRALVLAAHQEIAVVYGTQKETPKTIPASYDFPPGE